MFFATISFLFHDIANGSDNFSADNCDEINRLDAAETLRRICRNDKDFQNLTKGNYTAPGAIFNETGESVVCIRINGWYIHEGTSEMQNGTLKTIGPSDSLEDLYREADSLNGSVVSIDSRITGGEFYMITIDTPNKTVTSIEKVNEYELPEWCRGPIIVSEYEPADNTDKEKLISELMERTGYSREELFGPVNPFGNKTNKSEETLS
jgi:hypothetical protein